MSRSEVQVRSPRSSRQGRRLATVPISALGLLILSLFACGGQKAVVAPPLGRFPSIGPDQAFRECRAAMEERFGPPYQVDELQRRLQTWPQETPDPQLRYRVFVSVVQQPPAGAQVVVDVVLFRRTGAGDGEWQGFEDTSRSAPIEQRILRHLDRRVGGPEGPQAVTGSRSPGGG